MTLRLQLLLITLLVMVLPLGAWQFARQVEQTLRDGHAQGLLDSARSMAAIMAEESADRWPRPDTDVLYVHHPRQAPYLDGYADDWGTWMDQAQQLVSDDGQLQVQFAAAEHPTGLYLLFRVLNPAQVFSTPAGQHGDHLSLELLHPDKPAASVVLAPLAPGWIETRGNNAPGWPRVQGYWQPRGNGWTLELQIPDDIRPERIGFSVHDVDRPGTNRIARRVETEPGPLTLIRRAAIIDRQLARLTPANTRSWATQDSGWVLGHADNRLADPADASPDSEQPSWLGTLLFERLLSGRLPVGQARHGATTRLEGLEASDSEPTAVWTTRADSPGIILTVSAPVLIDGHYQGSIVIERDADQLLIRSNRAVLQLLGISMATLALIALILLGFATVLSERIRRLRNAAEQAVGADGQVRHALPRPRARDEIGDLGRSVSSLLGRLREHQAYLRTLADKLAHELRTPLAMIRSSLENLEHARDPDDIARYCQRANEGSVRLNRIFQAMSQAARIEESIQAENREDFDLAQLLNDYIQACRQTYPQRRFLLTIGRTPPYRINGSPDLFAQLLDKLIDNAVDFSPDNGEIEIRLKREGERITLEIDNDGPALPEAVAEHLFDSMVSMRQQKTSQVHLGLGLYIARLITEHHQGRISAANSRRGCCIRMEFASTSSKA